MNLIGNWSYPTAIRFGAGRISELASACLTAVIKLPLLVTDRGLASLPITAQALDILDAAGLGYFQLTMTCIDCHRHVRKQAKE